MRTAHVLATVALVGGVVAAVHGCSHQDCCGGCRGDEPARFDLSCAATDLTGVVTTGPCERDAGMSLTRSDDAALVGTVFVQGQGPGVCHVELTFASGFTYSTDVSFASQSGGVCGGPQCPCGDYLAPTSGPFTVNNPGATCVIVSDSGTDAASHDADAGPGDTGSIDSGDAEAGIFCPPLDTTACGIPLAKRQAPCPTYSDIVGASCAQGVAPAELVDPCDGLLSISILTGIDSSAVYYFDSATHALVGIATLGNATTCVGGAPGFNPSKAFVPNCASEATVSFDDAGVCASLLDVDGSSRDGGPGLDGTPDGAAE